MNFVLLSLMKLCHYQNCLPLFYWNSIKQLLLVHGFLFNVSLQFRHFLCWKNLRISYEYQNQFMVSLGSCVVQLAPDILMFWLERGEEILIHSPEGKNIGGMLITVINTWVGQILQCDHCSPMISIFRPTYSGGMGTMLCLVQIETSLWILILQMVL